MWAIARPTVLKYVQPCRRMSGRNPDAENPASAIAAPPHRATAYPARTALLWNIGMDW